MSYDDFFVCYAPLWLDVSIKDFLSVRHSVFRLQDARMSFQSLDFGASQCRNLWALTRSYPVPACISGCRPWQPLVHGGKSMHLVLALFLARRLRLLLIFNDVPRLPRANRDHYRSICYSINSRQHSKSHMASAVCDARIGAIITVSKSGLQSPVKRTTMQNSRARKQATRSSRPAIRW